MRRPRPALLVAALALVAPAIAGCSSDGSDATGPDRSTTTVEASTTTTEAAPEPLADQAAPGSINGLTVQGDTLWIASIGDDVVLQVRRDDGAILQRIPTEGAGPDDVAVAPDGSVWTTGFTGGQLGRIADGAYEVVATVAPSINPLEFDPEGRLLVGTYGPDGQLFRLDPDQSTPFVQSLGGGLPDINAFGILDDGRIIAPAGGIAGPGAAVAITVAPVCTDDAGCTTIETIVDGLPPVAAGTVDPDGVPYLLANITGELIRIDVDAGTSEVERTVTEGAPFDNLAFADDGTLYLSSFTAAAVTEVAPDGTTRVIPIGG